MEYNKDSQYPAFSSCILATINEGVVSPGKAVDKKLNSLRYKLFDLGYVLISQLDCNHACGVKQVFIAKQIIVSDDEMKFAINGSFINRIRYQPQKWSDVNITTLNWNDDHRPFNKSYNLFVDRLIQLISMPGHSNSCFAT